VKSRSTTRSRQAAALLALAALAYSAPAAPAASGRDALEAQEYAARLSATRAAYFKVVAGGNATADQQAHAALAAFEQAFPGDAKGIAYHGSLQLLDAAHSWQVWNLHKQAADGISMLDEAVAQAPDEPEVRFLRAATDWHLPSFYHRREQSEADFAILAAHAEDDAKLGRLPADLAAASLGFWGQVLVARRDREGAADAFNRAIRLAPQSPAAQDARERLARLQQP
jgi:tetratricopeptide (TPR) repeat protein